MTLISLTDCCRLLAIDPKTLRRWLDLAHVPLLPHPTDARIKGLSASQLCQVAIAHHRTLADFQRQRLRLSPPVSHKSHLRPLAISSTCKRPSQSSLPKSWCCSSA